MLEKEFLKDQWLTGKRKRLLAQEVAITEKQLEDWFHDKRCQEEDREEMLEDGIEQRENRNSAEGTSLKQSKETKKCNSTQEKTKQTDKQNKGEIGGEEKPSSPEQENSNSGKSSSSDKPADSSEEESNQNEENINKSNKRPASEKVDMQDVNERHKRSKK